MDPCETTFTVTNQTDIDEGPLRLCQNSLIPAINVRNATGTLTFRNIGQTSHVDVQDSPQLEILDFPALSYINTLNINQATSLTSVLLPILGLWYYDCSQTQLVLWFNITSAPSLSNITLGDSECLERIALFDVPKSLTNSSELAPRSTSIYTNMCMDLNRLTLAEDLDLSGNLCNYDLGKLTIVRNFILRNAASVTTVDSTSTVSPLRVNDSMLLLASIADPELRLYPDNEIPLRRVGTIGQDLNITSNEYTHIAYDGLTEVGGSLYINSNTNCTFNFTSISTVNKALIFTGNADTPLPSFSSLERVENILVDGLIDTSIGPNIFPALRSVSNVTVKTSNDFDCSKLASQYNSKIIQNLQCNGRRSTRLTTGAWAGIGVSTGVVVIGFLGALIWLIVRYRRRVKTLETEKSRDGREEKEPSKEPSQPHICQLPEMCGRGVCQEMPDDHLVEMPTLPAELSTRSHNRAKTEAGEAGRAF
ncbi:hypothetical protein F4680DRAFT_405723 [Xylaria scruposa]|nr:hypothetical protein F4680DRAFT_405723 [Xylaria scruposa]